RSAGRVASELRRDFESEMERRHGARPPLDPLLATLFHALAAQVERVYEEAERVFPITVLDDLMAGLGMPPRLAVPAQMVVRFTGVETREPVGPDTVLHGYARTGELIGFAPDDDIELSPTTLAFAAVHENGRLYALSGARVPGGAAVAPSSVPLAPVGAPMLYLAFEVDEAHLGGLGVFLDADGTLTGILGRAPWQLLDERGCVFEEGVLRPYPGRGGVRRLAWLRDLAAPAASSSEAARALALPEGVYGARVFVFPRVPPSLRRVGRMPPVLREAAALLLPEEASDALERPLVWVQVPLPAGLGGVADAIQRVEVNAVTASNVETCDSHVMFERMGTAVRFRPEGRDDVHVVGVLSVVGERGDRYVEESSTEAALGAGRWRYRDGSFELRPAWHASGHVDHFAVVRLLQSDGVRGNGADVGQARRVPGLANVTAQVSSLTTSRGGAPPPAYAPARARFAELLRTRDRVVTAADVEVAAQTFEPRVRAVEVENRAEPGAGGVERVVCVTARVRPGDFADAEAEFVRLGALLEEHLRARSVLGQAVRVRVEPLP
ncbi:MAG TPA: hypothetical protein VFQ39_01255, partial [Longimicrobium sp.]|nr:hypothetical protein [Longimicrobium sp.]